MDLNNGGELEDLLAGFDGADIDILEEPKLELDKKPDEAEELLDLERPAGTSDKTEDPFRLYVREMRSVPLLKREGEVEIARRIERGQNSVLKALSRSPVVIQEFLAMGDRVRRGITFTRDVVQISGPMPSVEALAAKKEEFCKLCDEAAKIHKKLLQTKEGLLAA